MLASVIDGNNRVVNIVELDIDGNWSPPAGHTLGPAGGRIGDMWDGAHYLSPPVDVVPPEPAELAAYAADRRWQLMLAGITVMGLQIPGDDTSQTRLSLARARLRDAELPEPLSYTLGLVTVPLTLAMLDEIVPALAAHTQAAFALQAQVVAGILAGTITTRAEIDEVFDVA